MILMLVWSRCRTCHQHSLFFLVYLSHADISWKKSSHHIPSCRLRCPSDAGIEPCTGVIDSLLLVIIMMLCLGDILCLYIFQSGILPVYIARYSRLNVFNSLNQYLMSAPCHAILSGDIMILSTPHAFKWTWNITKDRMANQPGPEYWYPSVQILVG